MTKPQGQGQDQGQGLISLPNIGVGDGGKGARAPLSPKIREKYFSGNHYVKFGHFADF